MRFTGLTVPVKEKNKGGGEKMEEICGYCGAKLQYDAKQHKMVCPKCGAEFDVETPTIYIDEYGVILI